MKARATMLHAFVLGCLALVCSLLAGGATPRAAEPARSFARVGAAQDSSLDAPVLVGVATAEAEGEPEPDDESDDDSEPDDGERDDAWLAADQAALGVFAPCALRAQRPEPERRRSRALEPETPPPRA